MKKAVHLFISGVVQGIFFRRFVKSNADMHNVKGFIRNLEDGRVEVFLEGSQEDVDSMIAICKQGPASSKLRKFEEKEERFQDFRDFKILAG